MRKLKNSELNRLSVNAFKVAKKLPVIIVLDNIRSLNNIGAVFRTADAFLIQKIFLCGITATPPHNDIRKTALGSTESVEWEYAKSTLDVVLRLQQQNVTVISIEQVEDAEFLTNFKPAAETVYAFVFGNEVKGVLQEVVTASNRVIEIPQHGTKHSLNVSASAAVVIWDAYSKLQF